MVKIHKYHLLALTDTLTECINSETEVKCPFCKGILVCRDKRIRKYRDTDGKKKDLKIRRMKCINCKKMHHELPDFLIPGKQHIASTIQCAIEAHYLSNELVIKSTPDMTTVKVWLQWIQNIINIINSNLKLLKHKSFLISFPISIQEIVNTPYPWLSMLIDAWLEIQYAPAFLCHDTECFL